MTKHLQLASTALSAGSTIASGRQSLAHGNFVARQHEAQGRAELASASRKAADIEKQTRYVTSRAKAVAAASGGGPVPALVSELHGEGHQRALTALWEGKDANAGAKTHAEAARISGRSSMWKHVGDATGTIIENAPSLYEKYGLNWFGDADTS
jgi:hypothetical protein